MSRSSEDKAHRLNFDPDTVIDGEVLAQDQGELEA
jgi:hypothetical protein